MQCAAFKQDNESLDMIFACTIAGIEVDVLVDSGATHSFIYIAFAAENGIAMSSDSGVGMLWRRHRCKDVRISEADLQTRQIPRAPSLLCLQAATRPPRYPGERVGQKSFR